MGQRSTKLSWNTATALKLGRVSNLPTVWTNTLAGVVLAGASPLDGRLLTLLLAMSAAYIGGMFLNDAFDREIDAVERPERPIPSGQVSAVSVFVAGYGLLFFAIAVVGWIAVSPGGGGLPAIAAVVALAGCIVLYNVWHKANPISPFIMGLCRMLVYITAGWSLTTTSDAVLYVGATLVLCYLIGLTYTAKQENLGEVKNLWPLAFLLVPLIAGIWWASLAQPATWVAALLLFAWLLYALYFVKRRAPGDIPRAVVSMIAGIALVDAVLIATTMSLLWVMLAVAAFLLTLLFQRFVAGT